MMMNCLVVPHSPCTQLLSGSFEVTEIKALIKKKGKKAPIHLTGPVPAPTRFEGNNKMLYLKILLTPTKRKGWPSICCILHLCIGSILVIPRLGMCTYRSNC